MSEELREQRLKALQVAMGAIEKQFGKGSVVTGEVVPGTEFYSSGCMGLNKALGGGYGKGRIVEIYGPESSGKTTLALQAIAELQKKGNIAAFIDVEHALDPEYAGKLGVKLEELVLSQPDNGEQALEIIDTLVRSGSVDLIVLDSVAGLVTLKELEGDMGDAQMGGHARLMSQAMRKLTGICAKTGCTIIFINQIRMKIGVMFGNPETTTGGNALKFYASQRLDVRRSGVVKNGTGDEAEVVGSKALVKVIKNKLAPPFKECELTIRYGRGVDREADTLSLAVASGIVEKKGAWYAYKSGNFAQGEEKAIEYLRTNPNILAEIEGQL
jgi:recombination protein RecA